MKIIEEKKTWSVYYYWSWGNECKFIIDFQTREAAEEFLLLKHLSFFDGFEGYGIQSPYKWVLEDNGNKVFYFSE